MRLTNLLAAFAVLFALAAASGFTQAGEPASPGDSGKPPKAVKPDPAAAPKDQPKPAEPAKPKAAVQPEKGGQPDKPAATQDEPAQQDPRQVLLDRVGRLIMSAPFGGSRNSFLHSLLGYPDMTAGAAAPPGCGRGWISGEVTRSSEPAENGTKIDGTYLETRAGFSFSLSEMVETHGSLSGAVFGGDASVMWTGAQIVPADRTESFRVSRASLGAMLDVFPLPKPFNGLWGSIDVKIPVADQDMTDAGRPGVAFSIVTTAELGPVFAHLNLGWFLSDGQQCFEPIATAFGEVRLQVERSMFWGVSLVWPFADFMSVGLQYTGNTNAFRDLNALDSDVHNLGLGFRIKYNTFYCEISAAAGLTNTSADFGARLEIGFIVDPALIAVVTQTGR